MGTRHELDYWGELIPDKLFEYEGGTINCLRGAFNLWERHNKSGKIINLGRHVVFIPPNAKGSSITLNRGRTLDTKGNLVCHTWPPITVEEARHKAWDITRSTVARYSQTRKNNR